MLLIIHLVILASFILLGLLFRRGKGMSLVAGYNTMSKSQRERVDEKRLARYMSNLMFGMAACYLLIVFSAVFQSNALLWIGFAAFLIVAIVGVIYMNTGNRIMKE